MQAAPSAGSCFSSLVAGSLALLARSAASRLSVCHCFVRSVSLMSTPMS